MFYQQLRKFIIDAEGDDEILEEEYECGLTPTTQTKVFKYVFDYIKTTHTVAAKKRDVELICTAVIELFPSLKIEKSSIGGIVSVLPNFVRLFYLCCYATAANKYWKSFFLHRIYFMITKDAEVLFTRNYAMENED